MIILVLAAIFLPLIIISSVISRVIQFTAYRRYMQCEDKLIVSNVTITENETEKTLEADYMYCGIEVHGTFDYRFYADTNRFEEIAAFPDNFTFIADSRKKDLFIVKEITTLEKKRSVKEQILHPLIALAIVLFIVFLIIAELSSEIGGTFDVFAELIKGLIGTC